MKKLIKVNFVILVIFSLIAIKSFAEENVDISISDENLSIENQIQEQKLKTDDLEYQKQQLEEQSQISNSQLEFVSEELSDTVIEVSRNDSRYL